LHIFANATSTLPCVGASGAIAGVMGAYVLLYPNASCKAWFGDDLIFFAFRTYKIPATLVIGGWFLMQLVLSYAVSLSAGGIAFHAHIGGFVAGMVLTSFLTRGAALPLAAEIPAVERHSAMDFYKNPRTFAMMGLGLAGTLFALYHPPRLSVGYSVALPPSAATPAAQTSHAKPKRIARAAPRAPKTHTPHAHQNSKNTVL